jgi:hypothetical protein
MYCIRFCGGKPPAKKKARKNKIKIKEKKKGVPAQFPAWISTKKYEY